MLNKFKEFCNRHKEDIIVTVMSFFICTTIILSIFMTAIVAMTNDLVEVVDSQKFEIEELKRDVIYYKQLSDDVLQTYEESVPKLKYDTDIQYYQSVIDELRTQCTE